MALRNGLMTGIEAAMSMQLDSTSVRDQTTSKFSVRRFMLVDPIERNIGRKPVHERVCTHLL